MGLKLYFDLMSQPSRALYMFLKLNKIPFEECAVALRKGEHLTDDFAKINQFKKVPAIDHDGFKLAESVAIFDYLKKQFGQQIPDHWYPDDAKQHAKVEEFLSWQQHNLRAFGSMYFKTKFIDPFLTGKEVNPKRLEHYGKSLDNCLNEVEQFFLTGRPFLTGQQITVADLLGACEVEQPKSVGFPVFEERPILKAWMNRVRDSVTPELYDKTHKFIVKINELFPPSSKL